MTDYIMNLRKRVGHMPILQCGASVIVENNKGEILLILRKDNKCWGYPGGSVELDEVVEEAAKRELREETGLTSHGLELFGVFSGKELHYIYPNGDEVSNIDCVYICREYSGDIQTASDEAEAIKFFNINDLPQNISPPNVKVVNEYVRIRKKVRLMYSELGDCTMASIMAAFYRR